MLFRCFGTRRRGKRAGALVKLRQGRFRTPLPSIHLANICSLSSKTDKLLLLSRTNKGLLFMVGSSAQPALPWLPAPPVLTWWSSALLALPWLRAPPWISAPPALTWWSPGPLFRSLPLLHGPRHPLFHCLPLLHGPGPPVFHGLSLLPHDPGPALLNGLDLPLPQGPGPPLFHDPCHDSWSCLVFHAPCHDPGPVPLHGSGPLFNLCSTTLWDFWPPGFEILFGCLGPPLEGGDMQCGVWFNVFYFDILPCFMFLSCVSLPCHVILLFIVSCSDWLY